MALLVLLAAAARARVVAADLWSFVPDRLHRGIVAAGIVHDERLTGRMSNRWRGLCFLGDDRTETPEIADRLGVNPFLHLLEHLEAFLLVLDKRIALPIAAQANAFLEVIQAVEMILPLLVGDLEHDVALDPLKDLAADDLLLFGVGCLDGRPQLV